MSLDGGTDFTNFCPDIDLSTDYTWRLTIARYGDGYEQRVLDGINALDRTWSVVYSNRAASTIARMVTILTDAQGGAIAFRDPATAELVTVFADEWTVTWANLAGDGPRGELQVEFRKANGIKVAPATIRRALVPSRSPA